MILRAAALSDIKDIMTVESSSFVSTVQEDKQVFAERIKTCTNCFILFLDEKTNTVAGYFSAERWISLPKDDSAFLLNHSAAARHTADGPVLYLSSFALLPAYRGKGLGTDMFVQSIRWFCSHAHGITDLLLLVNETWHGAVHIYTTYGFKEIRRIPSFFHEPDGTSSAGIIMIQHVSGIEK